MLKRIRRYFPAPLKQRIRALLTTLEDQTTIAQRVQMLEQHVRTLQALVLELQPDIIPLCDTTRAQLLSALGESLIAQTNLNISKHDLMFQWTLRQSADVQTAAFDYLCSGASMARTAEALLHRRFGDLNNIAAVLDFASGYGRFTRFLAPMLPPKRIWVSDIKAGGVQYQEEQFGVHGVVSVADPAELVLSQQFDSIFVWSLFSHLPKHTFSAWLKRLIGMLTAYGILVLSTHDLSTFPGRVTADFHYISSNEETVLRSADPTLHTDQYGLTYVSERYMRGVVAEIPGAALAHYPRAWGLQDLYVITTDGSVLDGVTLSHNPRGW